MKQMFVTDCTLSTRGLVLLMLPEEVNYFDQKKNKKLTRESWIFSDSVSAFS